jgi:hypothetical protein
MLVGNPASLLMLTLALLLPQMVVQDHEEGHSMDLWVIPDNPQIRQFFLDERGANVGTLTTTC